MLIRTSLFSWSFKTVSAASSLLEICRKVFIFGNSLFICFCFLFIYLFWLCWVFVSVWGLSSVAASGGHSSSRCAGLSLSRPLLLRSTGSRRAGSVVVAHRPTCSAACGTFPDQGSNPCPLHWQADSEPLRHPGSPATHFLNQATALVILHDVLYWIATFSYIFPQITWLGHFDWITNYSSLLTA